MYFLTLIVLASAGVDALDFKNRVLVASTDVLCKEIEPRHILRTLLSCNMITTRDKEHIKHEVARSDKVEKLLDVLQRKPIDAYCCFVQCLRNEPGDTFKKIKDIETRILHGKS